MSRIAAIDPKQANGKAADTLAMLQRALGMIPNMFRVAAQAPSVLQALVGLNGALAQGTLKPSVREAIALTVSQVNGCQYCLTAHSVVGKSVGLSDAEVANARSASSPDPKTDAILRFAKMVAQERGRIDDEALARLQRAGVSEAETLEVIANVGLSVFTNYMNIIAETESDFSAPPEPNRASD